MADLLLGVFTDRTNAENAIEQLKETGFNTKDISIVMKDNQAAQEFAGSTGTSVAEGAVSGATTGGVIGGLAGLLIGIGAISVPGIGAILIGGPIAAALGLTGAAASTVSGAVTGALAGGLVGALVGLGVPEEDARYYEQSINQGAILVAVPTQPNFEQEARTILETCGAQQVRVIKEDLGTPRQNAYFSHYQTTTPQYGYKGGETAREDAGQPTRNEVADVQDNWEQPTTNRVVNRTDDPYAQGSKGGQAYHTDTDDSATTYDDLPRSSSTGDYDRDPEYFRRSGNPRNDDDNV